MANYDAPTELQVIPSDAFQAGKTIDPSHVRDLALQGNTMWSGSGAVWLNAVVIKEWVGEEKSQTVTIPPQVGIRGVKIGAANRTATNVGATLTVTISDETGTLATKTYTNIEGDGYVTWEWDDLTWSRATDGWIKITAASSYGWDTMSKWRGSAIMIVPYPQTTVDADSEASGWIGRARTVYDEGISVRLMNQMLTQIWDKWSSNNVFFTRFWDDIEFTHRDTGIILAADIPVRLRPGRKLGFSVQGFGNLGAQVVLHLGGESAGVGGGYVSEETHSNYIDVESTGAETSAWVSLENDSGTFTLKSISIYEQPEV